jgi:hypothetical protein
MWGDTRRNEINEAIEVEGATLVVTQPRAVTLGNLTNSLGLSAGDEGECMPTASLGCLVTLIPTENEIDRRQHVELLKLLDDFCPRRRSDALVFVAASITAL